MRKDVNNILNLIGGDLLNKSAVARSLNCSWKTVDRMINPTKYDKPKKKRVYTSKLEQYKEIIIDKVDNYFCSSKSVYLFLKNEHKYSGSYSLVNKFVSSHKKEQIKKATIRYETIPGQQAQVDWKESFKILDKFGNQYTINIFLIILGFSRKKFIKLTFDRNQNTLFECMSKAFEFFGGTTKEILFDNMKTVVDHAKSNFSNVVINEKFRQFAKDANFSIITCRAYRPQTKGKVENLAKIMDRLKVYNNEFENISQLEDIINKLNFDLNNEIVQGLDQTPNQRFEKERSTMTSVNLELLKKYYAPDKVYKVSNESMINYKSHKYSVPTNLIGKYVTVKECDSRIYIYYTTDLICSHQINENFKYNYKESHYIEILKQDAFSHSSDEEIETQIKRNLEIMDNIIIEKDDDNE